MDREIKIDIRRCIFALFSKWWIIAISTIIFGTLGIVMTNPVQPPEYEASATVYSIAYGSYQKTLEGASIMKTYADIVTSRKVAERASLIIGDDSLTGEMIQSMVNVGYDVESPIIVITAHSASPERTIKIANAVADAFVIEVKNITGSESVQLLDSAIHSGYSAGSSGSNSKKRLIFVAVGLIFPCLFIVLKEILSNRLNTVTDASLDNELEIIGVIPMCENCKGGSK